MKEITGRHVLIAMIAAFGIIIAANVTLAVSAIRTFPGLEVKNSYVASQNFDRERAAQIALGWTVNVTIDGNELKIVILGPDGKPVRPAGFTAIIGRSTHVADDRTPDFDFVNGAYTAPLELGRGKWEVRLEAAAENGTVFRQRVVLFVRDPV